MARILLGWELGDNSGHAVKLDAIARILAAGGHEVAFAVQNIARFAGRTVWQAPLWPSQMVALSRAAAVTPATMGDILVALGLADPGVLATLIGAWDRLLAAIRPDAIVAEFAPALLLAAAGRIPVVSVGSGFTLPPGSMPHFPSLTGAATVHEEAPLVDLVNAALAANDRPPIDALPQIFAATREMAAVFTELDPYRQWRTDPPGPPSLAGAVPPADPAGNELFVYVSAARARPAAFWQGLQQSGLRIRLYDHRLNAADRSVLRGAGFVVEERPVPFAEIARRTRLIVTHCGLGMMSSAMRAGLPMVLVPFDIEKRLNAAAATALGLGRAITFEEMEAAGFARFLRDAAGDDAFSMRARQAAPAFRARLTGNSDDQAAAIAIELAG